MSSILEESIQASFNMLHANITGLLNIKIVKPFKLRRE